jgi:hypothetical protein
MITNINPTIYNKLKEITELEVTSGVIRQVFVHKGRPQEELELSEGLFVIYKTAISPRYTLNKEVAKQDTLTQIELYGLSSIEVSLLLSSIEGKMLELDFLLADAMEIPDPVGYHITAVFNF